MYVTNSTILELQIFSGRDVTSDYGFLLRLVIPLLLTLNYLKCYKVNDMKIFQNLVGSFYAMCSQIISMYIATWLI